MANTWKTRFSEEIDTKWRKIEFSGFGILEVSHNDIRYVLGGEKPTDEIVGAVVKSGKTHEFFNQTVWLRASEHKVLVTIHDQV